jgi:hypothetical protein
MPPGSGPGDHRRQHPGPAPGGGADPLGEMIRKKQNGMVHFAPCRSIFMSIQLPGRCAGAARCHSPRKGPPGAGAPPWARRPSAPMRPPPPGGGSSPRARRSGQIEVVQHIGKGLREEEDQLPFPGKSCSSSPNSRSAARRGSSPLRTKPPAERSQQSGYRSFQGCRFWISIRPGIHQADMHHQKPFALPGRSPGDHAAGPAAVFVVDIQQFHYSLHLPVMISGPPAAALPD